MLSLQLKSGDYFTIGEDIAVQVFQQHGFSPFLGQRDFFIDKNFPKGYHGDKRRGRRGLRGIKFRKTRETRVAVLSLTISVPFLKK